MFSSGGSDGSISCRYFGTPPVTESTSTRSRVGVRSAFRPQNARQLERGSFQSECKTKIGGYFI